MTSNADNSIEALKTLLSKFDKELTTESTSGKAHKTGMDKNDDIALLEKVQPWFHAWLEFQSDLEDGFKGRKELSLAEDEKKLLVERGKKVANGIVSFETVHMNKAICSERFKNFHKWLLNETIGALKTLGKEYKTTTKGFLKIPLSSDKKTPKK